MGNEQKAHQSEGSQCHRGGLRSQRESGEVTGNAQSRGRGSSTAKAGQGNDRRTLAGCSLAGRSRSVIPSTDDDGATCARRHTRNLSHSEEEETRCIRGRTNGSRLEQSSRAGENFDRPRLERSGAVRTEDKGLSGSTRRSLVIVQIDSALAQENKPGSQADSREQKSRPAFAERLREKNRVYLRRATNRRPTNPRAANATVEGSGTSVSPVKLLAVLNPGVGAVPPPRPVKVTIVSRLLSVAVSQELPEALSQARMMIEPLPPEGTPGISVTPRKKRPAVLAAAP